MSNLEKKNLQFNQEHLNISISLSDVNSNNFELILNWFNHPNVCEHFAKVPSSCEELENYYTQHDHHGFVAIDNERNVVGVLTVRDNLSANRRNGYIERVVIDPEKHNLGIGSKMMKEVIDYSFSKQGLDYYKLTLGLVQGVDGWQRAQRVYQKMGFREVGIWRSHVVIGHNSDGDLDVRDAIWMDLMREEWVKT